MKTKISFILLLVTTMFFGQNQPTGEIVISKTNLISLLQKFKTQNNPVADKQSLTNEVLLAAKTVPSDSVMTRIRSLEKELASLRSKMDLAAKQNIARDTVFVSSLKTTLKKDTIYSVNTNTNKTEKAALVNEENKNYEQQLNSLNNKYDALLRNQERLLALQTLNTIAVPATVAVVSQKESKPVEKITTVAPVVPVSSLVVVRDSTAIQTPDLKIEPVANLVTPKEILKEKYAKIQAQVFFDNNSAKVGSTDTLRLEQIIRDLNENPSLSVFLEGYSSKSGNAAYNSKLSLLRNNAVKQVLIKNGISVKRIFSENHGVDASSTNEAAARRVDVSFEVME